MRRTRGTTAVEFALLTVLAEASNRVLNREQLLDKVWNAHAEITDRAIDTHITNLRRKLGENRRSPRFIATRYAQGYQFIGRRILS